MKHELETDFELNIASIVDCLTVLITYLLASATFLTLGMFAITVPTFSDEVPDQMPPEIQLTIQLNSNRKIQLSLDGKSREKFTVQGPSQNWDYSALAERLLEVQKRYPKLDNAVLSAEDSVDYQSMVKAVETIRKVFPRVAISTEDVGS